MKPYKKTQGVYYLKSDFRKADQELLDFLFLSAAQEDLNISRCCLHLDESSLLMIMLIAIRNKFVYPAHRHNWKDESYTIIKGQCNYEEYDKKSNLIHKTFLEEGDTLLNVSRTFHLLRPLTNQLAFIESTIGPFRKDGLEFLNE